MHRVFSAYFVRFEGAGVIRRFPWCNGVESRGNGDGVLGYLLCMTPLKSHELEFPPCNVQGKIEGKSAEMIIDSGCTRTLVHEKFVKNGS